MITNTVVLIIVAVLVALVLASVVVGFGYKLRAERRILGGAGILDEITEDARAAQVATEGRSAHVDSEIEAFRNQGRREESADSRQTADMRAQLKNPVSPSD